MSVAGVQMRLRGENGGVNQFRTFGGENFREGAMRARREERL